MTYKTALLFPGTGSQYAGMFKEFYERYPIVRTTWEEAGDVLKFNLANFILDEDLYGEMGIAATQASIFVCSIAAYRVLQQEVGIQPAYMAGHSMGEFSALTCAGALRYPDALQAVWRRALWMEEAVPEGGGLLGAVKHLPKEAVQEQCAAIAKKGQVLDIACYNAPDQVVIAGHRAAVQKAVAELEAKGGQVILMSANIPFHTSLMLPAASKLQEELRRYELRAPDCPVISNVTALPHQPAQGPAGLVEHLTMQLTHPVRWEETIRFLQEKGVSHVIELGPGTVLKRLNRKIARNIRAYAWDDRHDLESILAMHKLKPDFLDSCLTIAVSTPNLNRDDSQYAEEVIAPYQRIWQLKEQFEHEDQEGQQECLREALECLQRILKYKRVDPALSDTWISELEQVLLNNERRSKAEAI
jgi:[acyl-carrier-protein] S-malonyltransferase